MHHGGTLKKVKCTSMLEVAFRATYLYEYMCKIIESSEKEKIHVLIRHGHLSMFGCLENRELFLLTDFYGD